MSSDHLYLVSLKNKSVIITGGALGVGLATAKKFAAVGAYVMVADLNLDMGEHIAKELTAQGYHVQLAECDATVWKSLVSAFKKAVYFSPERTLDIAVLAAGISKEAGSRLVQSAAETELSLDMDPAEPGKRTIDIKSRWGVLVKLAGPVLFPSPTCFCSDGIDYYYRAHG